MGQVQTTLVDKSQQFAQAAQQLKEGAAITLQAPYFISFYPKYKEIQAIMYYSVTMQVPILYNHWIILI